MWVSFLMGGIIKMTVAWFHAETMMDLLKKYPNVSERDFILILNEHAEINKINVYSDGFVRETSYVMELDEEIADEYGLPCEIGLVPGNEGVIYYEKEDASTSVDDRLLVIELQDESSVPKVFYKGEEVKYKRNIYFDWNTDTDIDGGLTYAIEHVEIGNAQPTVNRIERRVKGHATD